MSNIVCSIFFHDKSPTDETLEEFNKIAKILNTFIQTLQSNINNIDESLKYDYIQYSIDNLYSKIEKSNDINNIINYLFEIEKIAGNYNINKIEKIKYVNNNCDIVLISQYYITEDSQRMKENNISLINNILNPNISKIYLLNEMFYNLEDIFNKIGNKYINKVEQYIIEKRITFHDAMAFANKFCKNKIIILSNLDIFFNEDIQKVKTYDFTNLFLSLSRYELLNDYNFNGQNQIAKFIHQGALGNPCIDSHDAWIFKSPIKMCNEAKIMLGSCGCDTIINYIYGEKMKYNIINPINSITTIHYHREKERNYRTNNQIRSHSGNIYNKDNKYNCENYSHKYILHKSILVCNSIESFCTFATKNAYYDLRLLLYSLEIYHKDIPIFIYCDTYISNKIEINNFNLKIYKKVKLDKYTDLNRQSMEAQNIFTEFLLNKANVIDYAMETYNTTLFIDTDIIILNKMDLLIDKSYDVGLSPHNIFKSSQKMFGVYNSGFMYIANNKLTDYWRNVIYTKKGFYEQQALDYFEEKFKVFKFDDSYNFGWWRLFQCENPQIRANLFITNENNIYYEYKTLKCIHTHLNEKNDPQTTLFNKFIIDLLEKIKHPMLKYIQNINLCNKKINNKSHKKIASFTQTYGNERYTEIILQKYDKVGQYMRNKCDKIIFSFHNCSLEIIEKSKKYLSGIYNNDKLEFIIYNNIDYITCLKETLLYLKNNNFTDIILMNDDEYFINNTFNLNNYKNLDLIYEYYIENNVKWLALYGKNDDNIRIKNKCIKLNNNLSIYSYDTKENKKINRYAWHQSAFIHNIDNLYDMYMNNLPTDIWNLEDALNYYFNNNSLEYYCSNIELVRAINLHGHNVSKLSLYDNLHRFFFETTDLIYSIVNNINTNKIKSIENNKPTIIIPKMPRNDFWHHNNDTFRELIMLWNENGLINLVEKDTKHVWYNKIGDILLYDRPTLDWLYNDQSVIYNKILFGNPIVPIELKNIATNWIFWGRSPRHLNYFSNLQILSYSERKIMSIFIGKIENNIQLQFRTLYPNIEKYIELYLMHKPDEPYKYDQQEYLNLLRQTKFGLSLRGYGPKCNREIELMALGTVPIIAYDVDMSYYDSPKENIHYFRFKKVEEIKTIIENCNEQQWNKMSKACVAWYNKNGSITGSFNTTQEVITNFDNLTKKKYTKECTNTIENNNTIENSNKQICIDDIKNNIVYSFGKEEEFTRSNLKSFFNINKIYELHKKKYNDLMWDNVNKFIKVQDKYIAKFENVKINNNGIMYNDKYIYTLNNDNYKKNNISKKEIYKFETDIIVFNCVQENENTYYNWLCEIYPRLLYIKLYIENNKELFTNKKLVLLLYYNDTFIKQFLEIINLNVDICPYNPNLEYYANVVYLYTTPFNKNPSKDSIAIIRQLFFNNSVFVPKINILIKRNNNRIISNIEEIYNLLKTNYNNHQWVVFDSEDEICKNSIKTIQLFSQANIIIGAHGGGLTNMIFSSSNAKIIELHPDNCGNVCYWHLSHVLENTHIMLLAKSISNSEIEVNIKQLDYTINKLINDVFSIDNI